MKTHQLLLPIVFLLTFTAYAQDDSKWTLEECVDYAFDNNLDVKLAELNKEASEAYLKQSKFSRVPTLNFDIYQNWRWGRSIDPVSNQFTTNRFSSNGVSGNSQVLLFNGMRQVNSVRQNEKDVEANMYDLESAKNEIALNVLAGYMEVIFTKELLETAEYQLQNTGAQLERTKIMVDVGSQPKSNLLDMQAQYASDEVAVVNAENNVNLALLRLKQVLQIPSNEPFEVVVPEFEDEELVFVDADAEDIYTDAELIMPQIKSAEAQVESAEIGEKIAFGGHFPTLSLGASISTNYSNVNDVEGRPVPTGDSTNVEYLLGYVNRDQTLPVYTNQVVPVTEPSDGYPIMDQWSDNIGYSFGFNLNIPILNGLNVKTNKQIARIQKERAEVNAEQVRNSLRREIETAYTDAVAASKTYNSARKQVEALEESFRATEKRYNNQVSTYIEYQVANNNLFAARSDLLRAKYDYIFKLKVLDFYQGETLTLD